MESAIKIESWHNVSEVELIYRHKVKPADRPKITCSNDAYKLLLDSWNPDRIEYTEQFKILLLQNCRVLGIFDVASGNTNQVAVDVKLVFTAALKLNASGIILAHNHPSGRLQPSDSDVLLTSNFEKAGKLLTIDIIDHIIVTPNGYYSFGDDGRL